MNEQQFQQLLRMYGGSSSVGMGGGVPPPGGGGGGTSGYPGAYPATDRFLQGINDFTNGPRSGMGLMPGYRGNVLSTDRPLPGELPNPRNYPGKNYYPPPTGVPVEQLAYPPQSSSVSPYQDNTAPWVEPTPIGPSGGYLPPHEAVPYYPDIPGQVQLITENNPLPDLWNGNNMDLGPGLPPSPDFGPSDLYLPNDYGPATVMQPSGTPGGYNPGIYDPGSYTPFTDFGGGGGYNAPIYDPNSYTGFTDFSGGGPGNYVPPGSDMYSGGFDVTSPSATGVNDFTQPIPTDYVSDPFGGGGGNNFNYPYYVDDFSGGGGGNAPTAAPGAAFDVNASAPNEFAPNSGPSMPFIDPNDPNNNLVRGGVSGPLYPTSQDVFPQPSMMDELGRPTDWQGAGQFMKDAAGNLVNAAGQIVATAAQVAKGIGGAIAGIPGTVGNIGGAIANNIMNDPGWSDPNYLASMGYTPGAGTGSWWPGQASNTNFGAGGEGGSFFGGTMNLNPMGGDISGSNNPFGAGQVGRSSVGPPQGGGGPPMWGPFMANSLGGNSRGMMLADRIRQAIIAGTYRPPPFGGPVYKYPSPVLQRAGMQMARNMGMVRTSGHFGGAMSFAPPGASAVNWPLIGQSMRDFYANRSREDVMGAAIGVGTRGFGTPHAHTPQTSPT